ncbi:bcl2-associated agonist of cell death [Ornithorhynchus anatinus]|uniref:bcl2-associated agonist of cell death n=1 Tax=Ornithorhynchus anatinus TaxID=9258 RepID=UPI0010A8FEBA|nr:bcl2-associated agonist of cell death [Ornithorhynchus anatinus]
MFQIPEFEPSERGDVCTPGGDPSQAPAGPGGLGRHTHTSPDLASHLPGRRPPPAAHLSEGPRAKEPSGRLNSEPPDSEAEEHSPFRGRSHSAPPILWVAQRYGRELRRMSDEFDCTFQGLPRPKSAGTAAQLQRPSGWTRVLRSWWNRSSSSAQ